MTDRFEDLIARSTKTVVFRPGALWKRLGNNQVFRRLTGDEFPVLFVPLDRDPPEFKPGTRYQFDQWANGVHAFLIYSASQNGAEIKGVAAFCMLDPASRTAAEHLLETTRDMNGELGGLPAKFRFCAARLGEAAGVVVSGVLEIRLQRLVEAWTLWKSGHERDREILVDRRCPHCSRPEDTEGLER